MGSSMVISSELSTRVNEFAVLIGGICSIFGSLYAIWRFFIYPHIYMKLKNMITEIYNVAMDASSIHEIIKKELSTNGGSSLKDAINRIESRLSIQDGKSRATLSLLDSPIWESDEDGNCVWVNRAYRRITGYDIDSVKDMGWISIIAPDSREAVQEEWINAIRDRRHFSLTYNIITSFGKILPVDGEGYPIYTNDKSKNNVKGHIGILLVKNS
jgi:PAS domain S-box-containing protein